MIQQDSLRYSPKRIENNVQKLTYKCSYQCHSCSKEEIAHYPLADEWVNKMWQIWKMKHNLATRRKEVQISVATWIASNMLRESHKEPWEIAQKRQSGHHGHQVLEAGKLGGCVLKVSPPWECLTGDGCTILNILKSELYT